MQVQMHPLLADVEGTGIYSASVPLLSLVHFNIT